MQLVGEGLVLDRKSGLLGVEANHWAAVAAMALTYARPRPDTKGVGGERAASQARLLLPLGTVP